LRIKLRGREFGSFDAFRRAVWGEVGKEATLTSQFNESNKKALRKGYSPFLLKLSRLVGALVTNSTTSRLLKMVGPFIILTILEF
jgi:hypothetical protein